MLARRSTLHRPVLVLVTGLVALLASTGVAAASQPRTVTTDPETDLTACGATLNATINPNGTPTTWVFRFVRVGDSVIFPPGGNLPGDSVPHHVSSVLSDVFCGTFADENQQYWMHPSSFTTWVRPNPVVSRTYAAVLQQFRKTPEVDGAQRTLRGTVPTTAPTVEPGPAAIVRQGCSQTPCQLPRVLQFTGTVKTHGALSFRAGGPKMGFEWGKTRSYGSVCGGHAQVQISDLESTDTRASYEIPACKGGQTVSAFALRGQTVHYRIVADAGEPGGPVYGPDCTITVPSDITLKRSQQFLPIPADCGSAPSAKQITAALAKSLGVSGKAAKIGAILKAKAYPAKFTAPSAGTATISWYQVPKGAHVAKAKKPVLIAKGTKKTAKKGKTVVKVKLTKKGKALLKKVKKHNKLKLTAKGTFKPKGGKTVAKKKTFSLKR